MNDYINLYLVYKNNNHKYIDGRSDGDNAKLLKEFQLNKTLGNPILERYCYKIGMHGSETRQGILDMRACRNYCIKMGVWWNTEPESYIFWDMGGEDDDDDYRQYAEEIRLYREWCKKRGHHWRNYKYSFDTVVLTDKEYITK